MTAKHAVQKQVKKSGKTPKVPPDKAKMAANKGGNVLHLKDGGMKGRS